MNKSRFTDEQIPFVLCQAGTGTPVDEFAYAWCTSTPLVRT